MKKVFLSGPIRGLDRKDALGWRISASEQLEGSFITMHALRGRESKETLPDKRIAVQRDKNDINMCDVLLVNDEFAGASMIGTSMEVLYAHQLNKLVILFGEAHAQDYWLNYHSHARFNSLNEACMFLKEHYL